jgi:omega-6 fatty acid desaturase (delta-12 desaturase)
MRDITIPRRANWTRDLAPYLRIDRTRSLGQLASVLAPYLGIWGLAWLVQPGPWEAVGLGILATVVLVRMYSLFHDLTHGALFRSREANRRWGTLLGFLLFTPLRWWQRQHICTTRARETSTGGARARSTR